MPKIRLFVPTGTTQVARFYKPLFKADGVTLDGFSKTDYEDVPLMVLENSIAGFENLVVFLSTEVYSTDSDGKTLEPIGRLLSLEVSDEVHADIMREIASNLVKKFKPEK